MKPEEAIKQLETIFTFGISNTWKDKEAKALAIQALEKQIPKKPIEFETAWLPYYQCGCGFKIDFHWKEDANYCQSCGTKIDWSVEE